MVWLEIYEHLFKNLSTLLKGLELSPRDQKIFSWWGEAGNIYLLFYAIDDLIVNLRDHYLKYFNFIDRFVEFTRRPGDQEIFSWWGRAENIYFCELIFNGR